MSLPHGATLLCLKHSPARSEQAEAPSPSRTSHLLGSAGHGAEFQEVPQMAVTEIMPSFHKQGTASEKSQQPALSQLTEPGDHDQ